MNPVNPPPGFNSGFLVWFESDTRGFDSTSDYSYAYMMDLTLERVDWRHPENTANFLFFDGHVTPENWFWTVGNGGSEDVRGLLDGLDKEEHDVWGTGSKD